MTCAPLATASQSSRPSTPSPDVHMRATSSSSPEQPPTRSPARSRSPTSRTIWISAACLRSAIVTSSACAATCMPGISSPAIPPPDKERRHRQIDATGWYNRPPMDALYGRHGSFTAQPGQGDALTEMLLAAAEALRTNDDCLLYLVSRSPDDPDVIAVTEVW